MQSYNYTGSYFNIETQEPLSDEGILTGKFGEIHFKQCSDGYAICDTAFKGSGFVCTPTSANIGYPKYINGVPVTEVHNEIKIESNRCEPIAIECGNIKRVYLTVGRKTFADKYGEDDETKKLAMCLFDAMTKGKEKNNPLQVSIDFYNEEHAVELCEIFCKEKCILGRVGAKTLKVIVPSVILTGKAHELLEYMEVSGKIYPYTYSDWGDDVREIDYFENLKNLKSVEGLLSGDICWNFKGCQSLERIRLADGIKKVPSYSFKNCSSLTDLYIPDTVSQIGEYAFEGCTKLSSIHLSSNIKKISKGLFKNCCSLEKCYLSDNIEEIEEEAFIGCTVLRKPWIPKGIKKIAENAFDNPSWAKINF